MKKSHRVAHEKTEAWWVLLLSLYNFYCGCQDLLFKKEYKPHYFFSTIVDAAHSLNPFPLIILFHFLSYRLSFLHLTNNDL